MRSGLKGLTLQECVFDVFVCMFCVCVDLKGHYNPVAKTSHLLDYEQFSVVGVLAANCLASCLENQLLDRNGEFQMCNY